MVNKINTFLILIVLSLGIVSTGFTNTIEDDPEVVSMYTRGKRLMREGNYFAASRVFEELEARFPNSSNMDLFVFQRSKAKYYYGEYNEASAGLSYFVSSFIKSKYLAEAYFFLGNSQYLNSKVDSAVKAYLKAYALSEEKALRELVLSSLISACKNATSINLTEVDLNQLSQEKKCDFIKPLADIYLSRGEINKANRILAVCGETISIDDNPELAERMKNKPLEIAVVLPLSGEMQTYGEEIYNGAVIAADNYRQETGKQIKIVPYDTKGDPIEAALIVSQLSAVPTTDVVIGPLTSEEAAVASASLQCASLPMIIPAATQGGLTRLAQTAFQLAPNIELEGISLAAYAYNQMNADSVAVISSSGTEHIRMTRAFVNHFKKLGGTVVAVEYYRSRDKDFGEYISDIKSILLGHPVDSTYYINENGDTLDFELLAAYVDCLFLPGEPKQLRQMIPQINFYNLNGFYLGTDGWGDNSIYKLGDNITKGAIFASPFLEGKLSDEFSTFATAYDARYGKRPQRLASLGFDAVRLVMQAVSSGISRDRIVENLRSINNYSGASGNISFGEYRENVEMPLYRIINEQHQSIDEPISDMNVEN